MNTFGEEKNTRGFMEKCRGLQLFLFSSNKGTYLIKLIYFAT